MDAPKLTLVTDPNSPVDPCSKKIELESECLIDACDLEGVDVEEIEDDGNDVEDTVTIGDDGGQWRTIGSCDSFENEDDEGDEERTHFEFSTCPECNSQDCTRPVKELCGHVKCRQCYINSEDGCIQCHRVGNAGQPTENKDVEPWSNGENNAASENEDEDEIVVIQPNEYVIELGRACGSKSIAVVSSETLRELGIHDDTLSGNNEAKTSNSENKTILPSNEDPENEKPKNSDALRYKKRTIRTFDTDHIVSLNSGSDDEKKYRCLRCEKEFSHEYHRKYHIYCNPENGTRPFVCDCSKEFISQSHYLYHVRSKHTGEKPYECPVCSQRFIQKVKLNRHMISHTSKPSRSGGSLLYLCAYCKKKFNSLANCRRHVQSHTENKPFTCETCQKSFKQKYSLDMHKRTHLNHRPFKCPDCDKAFSTAKDMRRHHLCHTGELPFHCAFETCQAKFRRKDNLERHIRQTHRLSDKMAKLLGQEAAKKYSEEMQLSKNNGVEISKKKGRKKDLGRDIVEAVTGT